MTHTADTSKKFYETPRMAVYGDVREITRGGVTITKTDSVTVGIPNKSD